MQFPPRVSFWSWWLYASRDKTVNCLINQMHFPQLLKLTICNPLSLWLCFILSQTLSLERTLCWVAICYLILLLMEASLFLVSLPLPPPPAPLLLRAPALDPVWRSCRLARLLLVRPPPLQHPSAGFMSAGCLGPWNHHRLQILPKTGGPVQTENKIDTWYRNWIRCTEWPLHRPLTHL